MVTIAHTEEVARAIRGRQGEQFTPELCGTQGADPLTQWFRAASVVGRVVPASSVANRNKSSGDPMLTPLRWRGLMIVADLLDLPIHNLHNFRADRFNFAAVRVGAVEKRFGDAAPVVSSTQP